MKSRKEMTAYVAYPYASDQSSRFAHSLLALVARDAAGPRRLQGFAFNSSGANITNARNEIVEGFLKSDADYLWFIDTDMVFEPDVLERLIEAAHPRERPIVGALCFSLQKGMHARPTIYILRADGQIGVRWDYPADKLIEVDATGTGCVLIHRSVFETMPQTDEAYPWFRESALGDMPVGEDITFCIRARAAGCPIYVDTRIKVGHEKTFVVDEDVYLAQREAKQIEPPLEPTYVVIASKNRRELMTELVEALNYSTPFVFDNGYEPPLNEWAIKAHGWPLHRMWNAGLEMAEGHARAQGAKTWNVAILNDDLRVPPDFISRLAHGLRSDDRIWITYPDVHGGKVPEGQVAQFDNPSLAGQTMAGYAFMVRGETGLRLDEQFSFWYGDSDLEKQVRSQGKYVMAVGGCQVEHLHPMESSREPERVAQIRDDEKKFAAKWDLDPDSLFLAQHPEFGQ